MDLTAHSEHKVLPFLHANSRRYSVKGHEGGAQWEWRSRDNRKGRHVLVIPRGQAPSHRARTTRVLRTLRRMVTVMAWWDVSWWIGILFTVGSAIFVVAGVIYWLPVAHPSQTYPYDKTKVGGSLSFVGATLFEIGGILLVIEAVNANQTGCFGWALQQTWEDAEEALESKLKPSDEEMQQQMQSQAGFRPDRKHCTHIHNKDLVKHAVQHANQLENEDKSQQPNPSLVWKWWPTCSDVRSHYMREIGFNANFILFVGATIFWITGLLALPGIYGNLSQGALWGVYWLTFLAGGICFTAASLLYILEAQTRWWKPAPTVVGWWVGVWNTVGSVGWTWAAGLGYCGRHWCEYQSELALVWAAAAFLVASVLLVYEAVEKWPISVERKRKDRS
ncbi:hypothetical protein BDW02DRAFT_572474 [Decorospora gaudefroyi]|uniref:Integral membrane protein n=1 Tax=Decorospora gaudefroyi TaxID=184978 RepID=A0A6A5K8M2_9PLEO|nr:hypothetical protein BDW02DRAFT_572474 [Decorospora gaudefroyi]